MMDSPKPRSRTFPRRCLVVGLLGVLCALWTASPVAKAAERRVWIVVRAGRLGPEEISPGSRSRTVKAWEIVLGASTIVDVRFPAEASPRDMSSLLSGLFPGDVATAVDAGADALARVDLPDTKAVRGFLENAASRKPTALRELEARFGAAPPRSRQESKAVEALHEILLGTGFAKEAETTGSVAPDGVPTLASVSKARVVVVRVEAASASEREVEARDDLLARIGEQLGAGDHLVVVNWPEAGPGSAFFAGPLLKSGRVFGGERPFAAVTAVVARILELESSSLPESVREEDVREMLR